MATVYEHRDEPEKAPPAANDLPDGYRPSPEEPFMNPRQLQYFREKLLAWKDAIHREAAGTLSQLQVDSLREADLTDRASSETDWSIELRTRDSQRSDLITKLFAGANDFLFDVGTSSSHDTVSFHLGLGLGIFNDLDSALFSGSQDVS